MTTAAVIGLGTMGAGIAAVMARAGVTVRATDVKPEAIERARAELPAISALLDRLGLPAKGDASGVAFAASLEEAVEGAGLVLENVPEKLELKQQLFRQIDAAVGADCIIASDTSGIPITKMQAVVSRPERVVGMHWSNPPHLIPMIEVVAGEQTGAQTRDWMVSFIRGLGLLPAVPRHLPSWLIVSRSPRGRSRPPNPSGRTVGLVPLSPLPAPCAPRRSASPARRAGSAAPRACSRTGRRRSSGRAGRRPCAR